MIFVLINFLILGNSFVEIRYYVGNILNYYLFASKVAISFIALKYAKRHFVKAIIKLSA